MSTAALEPDSPTSSDAVQAGFDRLKEAWRRQERPLTLGEREALLEKLAQWILGHQQDVVEAIDGDFGGRSAHETLMAEVWVVVTGIRHTQRHLKGWMRPERKGVYWVLLPATAEIQRQPLGVVGIISPWNYPFQLAVAPLVAAVAAGNKVYLKPSELTPRTSELLARMIADVFPEDHVTSVLGGADAGAAFSALPFDHLLFTGSTRVGRLVMQAAAKNLTPVTLELGGKSPAVVHPSYDVKTAAERIAYGKCLNAGQTCIAPDYALLQKDRVQPFLDALKQVVGARFPTLADNGDYTAIVNEQHRKRIRGLLDEAEQKGATLHWLHAEGALDGTGKLGPVAVTGVTEDMAILQEEIFGPVLPIVAVDSIDEAVAYVNDHPRPLAMYVFDNDRTRVDAVLARTTAGGVTVNDTILHIANEELPFGGVGPSGIGAYHGEAGFRTFSHEKSVFRQARLNGGFLIQPPYGKAVETLLKFVVR